MKVVKPETKITIEFTEEEATILCALAGGMPWNFDTHAGKVVRDFYDALDDNLPNRTQSFADFFEGEIRMVPR